MLRACLLKDRIYIQCVFVLVGLVGNYFGYQDVLLENNLTFHPAKTLLALCDGVVYM